MKQNKLKLKTECLYSLSKKTILLFNKVNLNNIGNVISNIFDTMHYAIVPKRKFNKISKYIALNE